MLNVLLVVLILFEIYLLDSLVINLNKKFIKNVAKKRLVKIVIKIRKTPKHYFLVFKLYFENLVLVNLFLFISLI